jgi:hypothetical protein
MLKSTGISASRAGRRLRWRQAILIKYCSVHDSEPAKLAPSWNQSLETLEMVQSYVQCRIRYATHSH